MYVLSLPQLVLNPGLEPPQRASWFPVPRVTPSPVAVGYV